MRRKVPLLLMEQSMMLLVFAFTCALCLRVFVSSDTVSRRAEAQDRAVLITQSATEAIRSCSGDLEAAAQLLGVPCAAYLDEGLPFEVHYGEDWTLSETREYAYCLRAWTLEDTPDGLGSAAVQVTETQEGETIFALQVSWQKEGSDHEGA